MKASYFAKTLGLISAGLIITSQAIADDPCAGHTYDCDEDGCIVCKRLDNGDLLCDTASIDEIKLALPGCKGLSAVKIRRALRSLKKSES